ncbi:MULTISPECIES: ferric reductase-like transmembrane domain-containing protein [Exiguobacterium]|uniref:ferric reductase-like transmembrane domain-containing protein n=1 Tax=Exiguobacterium TaxID=33986 RepID=UPI00047B733D|nr:MULTISPECIES: ferric reductase-like transmembrane domain-containing protein [Exiguobacterium]MCK2158604.1 ferric reductase-like transmembrane domain-containing protein [Exiguobacterium sp. 17-1]
MDWMKWLFSTWTMIRLSGLTGHFFLTLSVLAGLLGSFPALKKQKARLHNIHLYSGWAGLLAIVLHATLIIVDTYAPLSLLEILIPGTASYEPLWNAFGTISLYLFGFVLVTSDFLKETLGKTLWKLTHWLVLPAWLLMTLHGIFIGTDTGTLFTTIWYACSTLTLFTLILYRMQVRPKTATPKKQASSLVK